ncbi:nucleoside triphosphate pyrophosphohydrolase [Mycobacterium sp. IDR2000157661]|uniref:nucleoside triphosphate pyrophosphohydrolase n=1 Tax=Mycobacterium sp. IDR2000157661 TaxID=2867005 RepID=UPI001EEC1C36|nr:nucleoside triphosphate pyrophosphohydrolase [Mycobacterium sp. IDR2000157661]ULE31324.1 nucleoside triphosphate pyrophosphohydrolase [Mycobacterium sp. IDR2000157661]
MTVVLVDPRRPSLIPVDAIDLLTGDVQYTEEMPIKVPWSLPSARACMTGAADEEAAPVLLSSDPEHPAVKARLAAGDRLIAAPGAAPGERLVDAVSMMDRLRTAGPWESEQTHDSLRRYLLEETYEVFDAVRSGDAEALRDELGDVLLQVLFHARIAEDAPHNSFGIDDVADALVRKLGNRVPAVLAGETVSLDEQLAQWEERKALEKRAKKAFSAVDDVPTAQPALALAQKVIERVTAAGLPADLIPATITTVTVSVDVDSENSLRSAVLEFMDTVRRVEHAVAAGRRGGNVPEELDVAQMGPVSGDEWRAHWPGSERTAEPAGTAEVSEDFEAAVTGNVSDTEPAPDRVPEPSPADVPEPAPADVPESAPVEVPEPSPETADSAR